MAEQRLKCVHRLRGKFRSADPRFDRCETLEQMFIRRFEVGDRCRRLWLPVTFQFPPLPKVIPRGLGVFVELLIRDLLGALPTCPHLLPRSLVLARQETGPETGETYLRGGLETLAERLEIQVVNRRREEAERLGNIAPEIDPRPPLGERLRSWQSRLGTGAFELCSDVWERVPSDVLYCRVSGLHLFTADDRRVHPRAATPRQCQTSEVCVLR